ncbi:MAG: cysteine--tRNA ligase [Gammaproteobacteria bacterium]|nr:cysteine--tRNA ligase [Gammaproteobacteria bacterium]
MIQIYNSLTGRKDNLQPIRAGEVSLYLCGDTVYDFCHVGHARSKIAFDVVRRHLIHRGFRVTFVRNITDIDDKIIRRSAELGESMKDFTDRFIRAMHEDYDRLNILRPDHEPRATEHVAGMITLSKTLIDKGFAYVASNGDVMYSVSSFQGYGKLSGKRLADLRAGSRIDIDTSKRDPLDFVLWKMVKLGEPSWDSPWGLGRPGWHIECSVMSAAILGSHFDIHAGGMDLKFPHHENEIAQSCAATGKHFANVWMHNGFLNIDDEKMSKSLGNFFTIRDVLSSGHLKHPEVLRHFLISSHYRGPINYSLTQLEQADASLTRLYTALRGLKSVPTMPILVANETKFADKIFGQSAHWEHFNAAMDDDFNTPEAIAAMQAVASDINRSKDAGDIKQAEVLAEILYGMGAVLGVLNMPAEHWFKLSKSSGVASALGWSDEYIEDAIMARKAARLAKQFERSDEIRDQLLGAGIVLEDKPGGVTHWRRL